MNRSKESDRRHAPRDESNEVLDKSAILSQFSVAVKTYDSASVLQQTIANELIARIDVVGATSDRLLDLGSATGYLGRSLKKKLPSIWVVEVDMIADMVFESAKNDPASDAIISDAEKLALADESMPLILSNLLLHWCDIEVVLSEVARVLEIGGVFLFSTFGPDTLVELRSAWDEVDQYPHVHPFVDMHNLGDALVMTGFSEPVLDIDRFTITYRDVQQLISDLRNSGGVNALVDRRRFFTGKERYAQFIANYDGQRDMEGTISSTWEVIYGVATKHHSLKDKNISVRTLPAQS